MNQNIAIESNSVEVHLSKESVPEDLKSEIMVAKKATYSMNRKDYSNASEIIHEGLQRYPNSVSLYSTSGDILANQKNIADARSAYKKALEEYYKQYPDIYEPPVILLGKLKRLGAD